MLRLLLPILLLLSGTGGGVLAAKMLAPKEMGVGETNTAEGSEDSVSQSSDDELEDATDDEESDFVKLSNQFIVPILSAGRVTSMVVVSLSLEIELEQGDLVYRVEPKIRDAFLKVLFDHANNGGFSGAFTESVALHPLRKALRETAQSILGEIVRDVLIVDMVRQDN